MYGTLNEKTAIMSAPNFRKKMNIVPMMIALFFPWLVFCGVLAVLSFFYHYKFAYMAYATVGVVLMVVMMTGTCALEAFKGRAQGHSMEPHWYVFTFATSLLAWILAVTMGDYNFYYNMQPYYDTTSLNMYDGVDPSTTQGVELMDAGRIIFTSRAMLDLSKSTGFRNSRTYCVAPITVRQNKNSMPLMKYDFWAVGLDCCSDGNFRCGDYDKPRAHAGMRLLRDDQRPFFRLAVQQAEAAYGVKALHPVFFHWLADPSQEALNYQAAGFRWYFLGMFTHFVIQFILCTFAVTTFAKMEKFSWW